jgi:hypothetical protein
MRPGALWSEPRGRRSFTAVARDVTQLLAAADALHLLPTWLALQDEGWRQRRRNRLGTLGVSPAELCGSHDERGAAGVLGLHTTRSRATHYRHLAALEVLGLLERVRLRGEPRRGPGAMVLYALLAYLVTDHETGERQRWAAQQSRNGKRSHGERPNPARGPPDVAEIEKEMIALAAEAAVDFTHIDGPEAARQWLTRR